MKICLLHLVKVNLSIAKYVLNISSIAAIKLLTELL